MRQPSKPAGSAPEVNVASSVSMLPAERLTLISAASRSMRVRRASASMSARLSEATSWPWKAQCSQVKKFENTLPLRP